MPRAAATCWSWRSVGSNIITASSVGVSGSYPLFSILAATAANSPAASGAACVRKQPGTEGPAGAQGSGLVCRGLPEQRPQAAAGSCRPGVDCMARGTLRLRRRRRCPDRAARSIDRNQRRRSDCSSSPPPRPRRSHRASAQESARPPRRCRPRGQGLVAPGHR